MGELGYPNSMLDWRSHVSANTTCSAEIYGKLLNELHLHGYDYCWATGSLKSWNFPRQVPLIMLIWKDEKRVANINFSNPKQGFHKIGFAGPEPISWSFSTILYIIDRLDTIENAWTLR